MHSDVCGPLDEVSLGGHRYFVTFIDDKTRYTYVALLKTKDEVFEKFKLFKVLVEKQTGNVIKVLRSDNGGEYCSKYFSDFLKTKGIRRQLIIPGSPEQNGVAERANRTIMEKARAMLKDAGLSGKYWAEAVHTAVYLKNISPTAALKGMVPYEAWTGRRPHVGHLKVFGCQAYVHIPKANSKKLGDRALKCIFVGYDEEKKGYRLIDPNNPQKVVIERSVIFQENVFPSLNRLENGKRNSQSLNNVTDIDVNVQIGQNNATQRNLAESSTTEEPLEITVMDSGNEANAVGRDGAERRYPVRDRRIREYPDFVTYQASFNLNDEPETRKEALDSQNGRLWEKAMKDEITSLKRNDVWVLVPRPINKNIVES